MHAGTSHPCPNRPTVENPRVALARGETGVGTKWSNESESIYKTIVC